MVDTDKTSHCGARRQKAYMKPIKFKAPRLRGFGSRVNLGGKVSHYRRKQNIYKQGAPACTLFYIHEGGVRLSTRTKHQPSAVTAILGVGDLFGEALPRGLSPPCINGRCVDGQLHTYHPDERDAPNASETY